MLQTNLQSMVKVVRGPRKCQGQHARAGLPAAVPAYRGKPGAGTFVRAADVLHARGAHDMRLVVVAQVCRDAPREHVRGQPLARLERLVHKRAQLPHGTSSVSIGTARVMQGKH